MEFGTKTQKVIDIETQNLIINTKQMKCFLHFFSLSTATSKQGSYLNTSTAAAEINSVKQMKRLNRQLTNKETTAAATENTSKISKSGITFNTERNAWVATWKKKSVEFSVKMFGNKIAKILAKTALHEAEKTDELPSEEEALNNCNSVDKVRKL